MDHPDLAANAIPGWDMVGAAPVITALGFYHSTIGAGLAGAVINNAIGVAGVVNCQLMPINIGDFPTLSDMYKAILWTADHGVRVVNLSWDGAYSAVVNDAGAYLKNTTRGMLFMAGVNGFNHFLDYTNQPDIYAISMTDTNDAPRSAYGFHIDFAAPGYQIYSTTTNSGYEFDSGSSYSTPLAAGLAAFAMSVNPELGPDEIFELMRASAADLGTEGWDQFYGWGRLDFGKLSRAVFATLPVSRITALPDFTIEARFVPGTMYQLLRANSPQSQFWSPVPDFSIETNATALLLRDLSPLPSQSFYQLQIQLP
jgi:subtilisin family serine protease